jgi:hypothetical protein
VFSIKENRQGNGLDNRRWKVKNGDIRIVLPEENDEKER